MKSLLKKIGPVTFPEFMGERVYMKPFYKFAGLPDHLKRWSPTVSAMLEGVETDGPIYLMIDQGFVAKGETHRRRGAHIDGNWIPLANAYGGTGHGRHGWKTANLKPEGLILAASVCASRAFVGDVEGDPNEGGDCSHLDLSRAECVPLNAGIAYAGNVTMIHESLPVLEDCFRTVVRLNVPGWTP